MNDGSVINTSAVTISLCYVMLVVFAVGPMITCGVKWVTFINRYNRLKAHCLKEGSLYNIACR